MGDVAAPGRPRSPPARGWLALALLCGAGLTEAAEVSPEGERYSVQRASLRAVKASEDGRYQVSARLKRTEPGSTEAGALTLHAQVKSLNASCGPLEPLFVDSFE